LISDVSTLAALILTLAGVAMLYFRWCRHTASQGWWTVAGWLLLVMAMPVWAWGHSTEFSVMYALLVPGVLAWLFVGRQWLLSTRLPGVKRKEKQAEPLSQSLPVVLHLDRPTAWAKLLLRALLVIPCTGVVSLLATVALTDLLPWIKNDTLALALLSASLVWGVMASWLLAQASIFRPVIVLMLIGLLSALYLYG
jgi:hypothetical protein